LEKNTMKQATDPFDLAALPELRPPTDGWIAISAELKRQGRRRQQWLSGLALAATITLVVGVVSMMPRVDIVPPSSDSSESAAEITADSQSGALAKDTLGSENLASLQRLSRRLEQNLSYLSTGMGAVPAEMVVYQVELEDLVAQVDAAISLQPESSELWRQRVNLLMDLNKIYGVGLRRDESHVASL